MAGEEEGAEVDAVDHGVEALEGGIKAARESGGLVQMQKRGSRWRRISSWALVVLACVLAVVSVFVVFVRNELLNTDAYLRTVAPLASNPAIQSAVATRVSQRLIAQTNVEQQVKQALPAKAGFLAPPITSGLQNVTERITLTMVQSSQFQTLWVAANRSSHKQLVALLTGSKEGALGSANGEVTLDLTQVEAQAKKALDAKGITVYDRVPSFNGPRLVLFRSTQLVHVQRLTRLLNHLALVLPIVTLLCFAGGVALTMDRRRGLVRAATGLALSMALVLVGASVARNLYLSSLDQSQSKAATAAVIDAVSAVLLDSVRTVLVVAALIAIAGFVAGSARLRGWLGARGRPSWLTDGPVHGFAVAHRRGLQWGVLAVGLLILVVWNMPTALVAVVVVLVALAVAGLVGLYARRGPSHAD